MELNWKIEAHPSSIKATPAIKEWFNRIVCTTNATLEIPINENIFYPVSIPVDPAVKGVSNLMLVKAAFQFYFETGVNKYLKKKNKIVFDVKKFWWM